MDSRTDWDRGEVFFFFFNLLTKSMKSYVALIDVPNCPFNDPEREWGLKD